MRRLLQAGVVAALDGVISYGHPAGSASDSSHSTFAGIPAAGMAPTLVFPPGIERFSWVAEEVRGLPTRLAPGDEARLLESFSLTYPGKEDLYLMEVPDDSARVCDAPAPTAAESTSGSTASDSYTYMYEYVVNRIGARFPLSLFERAVLRYLQVAPSQLHPNAWGFVRAFDRLCSALYVTASTRLFFNLFDVHRPGKGKGWVSLKKNTSSLKVKLFEPFSESYKRSNVPFKSEFFRVRPKPGTIPCWLHSTDPAAAEVYPCYWSQNHWEWTEGNYHIVPARLDDWEVELRDALIEAVVLKKGPFDSRALVTKSGPDLQAYLGTTTFGFSSYSFVFI